MSLGIATRKSQNDSPVYYTDELFCALEGIMRTPLEALTEIRKRIEAKRADYLESARIDTDAGFRTKAVDNAMQAASLKEALDIITDVEQGR